MSDGVSFFGIRHHGPGCARSLRAALERLRPDCVLVEGPAGAEPLLAHLLEADLSPPVALLSHATDDPQLAVFHPYAVFSPEWQAMHWAAQERVPVQFIDVPASLSLAWQQADRDAAKAAAQSAASAGERDVSVEGAGERERQLDGDSERPPSIRTQRHRLQPRKTL